MDAIEITVRYDQDGQPDPLSFTWQGLLHRVDHTGRRWVAEDGVHVLVMDLSGRIFELLWARPEGRWYLVNASPAGMRA